MGWKNGEKNLSGRSLGLDQSRLDQSREKISSIISRSVFPRNH